MATYFTGDLDDLVISMSEDTGEAQVAKSEEDGYSGEGQPVPPKPKSRRPR